MPTNPNACCEVSDRNRLSSQTILRIIDSLLTESVIFTGTVDLTNATVVGFDCTDCGAGSNQWICTDDCTLTENRSIFTESFTFTFETNTSSGTTREVLVLSTPYSDNDAVTNYLTFVSPDDDLTISSFDKGMSFDYNGDPLSGGQLAFNSDSPIIFTVGEAFSVDALSLSFTVNGDSGAADQVLTADGAGNATWKYPSIDVAPYDAGNGAWVTATGTGITFAKAGGNGTFTIPGGVRLKGFRVEGQTSDLAGDNSFTLTFTGQFANTTLATIYPPIIQKYNRNDGTSPGSNAWDYDIDNTPKWSISGFNPLVIKGINMNAFSHWGLIGVWA